MHKTLATEVGRLLVKNKLWLVIAESCTGGLISHYITNIPGSSEYYAGGVCVYSYEAKRMLVGVKPATLTNFGAVSKETVEEMALGVRKLFSKEFPVDGLVSISVSGIAGPGGGMPNKPVGLVWMALSTANGTWAFEHIFPGNREAVKEQSAVIALTHLHDYLNEKNY